MPIQVTNDTHWRTPDIKRLVKTSLTEAGADLTQTYKVEVSYNIRRRKKKRATKKRTKAPAVQHVSTADVTVEDCRGFDRIVLKLPKLGPRDSHDNPMVAIATEAAAPGEGDLLAASECFRIANWLINYFWNDVAKAGEEYPIDHTSSEVPAVGNAADFLLCKVKDPLQDGTYLDFVKKKEAQLKRAHTSIEKETANIEAAKRRLGAARKRVKEIEKSLKGARERRS